MAENRSDQFEMGGQAVIEGVMMRSRQGYSVAIRKKNGEIKVRTIPYRPLARRFKFFSLPFIRGAVGLFEMMIIGIKALNYSANEWEEPDADEEQEEATGKAAISQTEEEQSTYPPEEDTPVTDAGTKAPGTAESPKKDAAAIHPLAIAGMMAIGFSFAILLVVVIPNLATSYIGRLGLWHNDTPAAETQSAVAPAEGEAAAEQYTPSEKSALVEEEKPFLYNLIAGVLRACIIFGYIFLISFMKDIRRIFQYHGAEHKTVYAFEHGDEINTGNARKYTTVHPRCGSSFLGFVIFVTIIVFALIAWLVSVLFPQFTTLPFLLKKLLLILLHILFLPLVAGTSYELMKLAARHHNNPVFRVLLFPGTFFQRITTREPDEDQIEVAIASLHAALNVGDSANERVISPAGAE